MDLQDLNPPETYIRSKWVDCENCEGHGDFVLSHCCDVDARDGFCSNCLEICEYEIEDCKECEGTGQVEILID